MFICCLWAVSPTHLSYFSVLVRAVRPNLSTCKSIVNILIIMSCQRRLKAANGSKPPDFIEQFSICSTFCLLLKENADLYWCTVIWKAAFWRMRVWNGNLAVAVLRDFLRHGRLIALGLESEVCWRWTLCENLIWEVASPNASPSSLPCVNRVPSEGQDGLEREEWRFGLVKRLLFVRVLVYTHAPNADGQRGVRKSFLLSPN